MTRAAPHTLQKRAMKRPQVPSVKTRNREQSMARLLDAAIEIFSRDGFDGATTRVIADKAGVNEALINRYFDGKSGLLTAISKKFLAERAAVTFNYPPCSTVEEELMQYALERFEHEAAHRDLVRISISRCAVDPKFCQKIRETLPHKDELFLQERMKAFQISGKIREDLDVAEICRVIGSQVFSMTFISYMVFGLDKKSVLKSLRDFCETYARGLKR